MKDNNSIENILASAAAPSVRTGHHRESLKAKLMDRLSERDVRMKTNKPRKLKSLIRVAAMILAAVVLVSAGWAAEQAYRKVTWVETTITEKVTTVFTPENGVAVTLTTVTTETTEVDPNIPHKQGKVDESAQREEIAQAISQGKYKFVREVTNSPGGEPSTYIYSIELPSGALKKSFAVPPEKFESWNQFEALEDEARREHYLMCYEAIEAGRYRLVNVETHVAHICREVETGEDIICRRINTTSDGIEPKAIITLYQEVVEVIEGRVKMVETTWQDHLDAIANGSRELIRPDISNTYSYELTLSDGRVVPWQEHSSGSSGNKPPLD